jgi:hypothetical protein
MLMHSYLVEAIVKGDCSWTDTPSRGQQWGAMLERRKNRWRVINCKVKLDAQARNWNYESYMFFSLFKGRCFGKYEKMNSWGKSSKVLNKISTNISPWLLPCVLIGMKTAYCCMCFLWWCCDAHATSYRFRAKCHDMCKKLPLMTEHAGAIGDASCCCGCESKVLYLMLLLHD